MKNFLLASNQNLSSFSLKPFSFVHVLSLSDHVKNQCPSFYKQRKTNFKEKKNGRLKSNIRKKLLVRPWHRLPREAVDAPFLEAFKARLDEALGSLFWWKVSISMEGGLEMDYLKFSSFYD